MYIPDISNAVSDMQYFSQVNLWRFEKFFLFDTLRSYNVILFMRDFNHPEALIAWKKKLNLSAILYHYLLLKPYTNSASL